MWAGAFKVDVYAMCAQSFTICDQAIVQPPLALRAMQLPCWGIWSVYHPLWREKIPGSMLPSRTGLLRLKFDGNDINDILLVRRKRHAAGK
jgi:hypothetical protein